RLRACAATFLVLYLLTLMAVTATRATGATPLEVRVEMPSIWSTPSDRTSQSIGPGVQTPGPLTTVPGCTANNTRCPPFSTPSSTSRGSWALGSTDSRSSGSIVLKPPEASVIANTTWYASVSVKTGGPGLGVGGGGVGVVDGVVVVGVGL